MIGQDRLTALFIRHLVVSFGMGERDRRDVIAVVVRRIGKLDPIERVHIEVLVRSHPGEMGLVKAAPDEKWLSAVFAQNLGDAPRSGAIGFLSIGAVRGSPGELQAAFARITASLLSSPACGLPSFALLLL